MFCYKCRITVRDWNDSDDPWIRHAKSNSQCPHIEKIKGQEFLDYISRCPSKESDEVDSTSEPKELRVVPQPIQEDPMVHQTTSKIKALVSTEEVQKVNYEQNNDIFKQIFCDDRVCKSAIIEKKYKFGRTIEVHFSIEDKFKMTSESKKLFIEVLKSKQSPKCNSVWIFLGCSRLFNDDIKLLMELGNLLEKPAKYRFENVERTIITFKGKIGHTDVEHLIQRYVQQKIWHKKSQIVVLCGHHHKERNGEVVLGETDLKLFANCHASIHDRLCKKDYWKKTWKEQEYRYHVQYIATKESNPTKKEEAKYELIETSIQSLQELFEDVLESKKPYVLIFASCHSYYSELKSLMSAYGLYFS